MHTSRITRSVAPGLLVLLTVMGCDAAAPPESWQPDPLTRLSAAGKADVATQVRLRSQEIRADGISLTLALNNLGFAKRVGAVYSLDQGPWQTAFGTYASSENYYSTDIWSVTLSPPADWEHCRFALFYHDVATNRTYWDSNGGRDHQLEHNPTLQRLDDTFSALAAEGGTVRIAVLNKSYEKQVGLSYTLDGWSTASTLSATYAGPSDLPGYEIWQATLSRSALGFAGTIEYAVSLQMLGQQHWDNNGGANYVVTYGNTLTQRWVTPFTDGQAVAMVFAADGAAYAATASNSLHALAADGQPLWRVTLPGYAFALKLVGDLLLVSSGAPGTGQGELLLLDRLSGATIKTVAGVQPYRIETDATNTTLLVSDTGTAFFDAASRSLGPTFSCRAGNGVISAFLRQGRLYCQNGASLEVYDAAGAQLWTYALPADEPAKNLSAQLYGVSELGLSLVLRGATILAVTASGKKAWSYQSQSYTLSGQFQGGGARFLGDGTPLIVEPYVPASGAGSASFLTALEASTGKPRWQTRLHDFPLNGIAAVVEDRIFIAQGSRYAIPTYVYDAQGQERWSFAYGMSGLMGATDGGVVYLKGTSIATSKTFLVAFATDGTILGTTEAASLQSLFIAPGGQAFAFYQGVVIAYGL